MESNQYLLANAYSAIGQAGLKRFLYLDFISCLGSLIDQGARRLGAALDADYRSFMCAFYAEAIAGTLDYITHPQARSREKVVSYLKRLLRSSLPAAIQAGAEAR